MADNEDLARVTGIPTERVVRWTWVIGGGLTGAAGFLIALERGTISFQFGWVLLLLIFAAVILGGIGSVYGAIVGGIVMGLASSVSLVWIPSEFSNVAAFAIMIFVLLYRPEGLFSGRTTA
jgi:branched-chain amino acid transport system permease protein